MRAKMYSFGTTFFSLDILYCVQTTNASQIQRDVTVIVVVFFLQSRLVCIPGGGRWTRI